MAQTDFLLILPILCICSVAGGPSHCTRLSAMHRVWKHSVAGVLSIMPAQVLGLCLGCTSVLGGKLIMGHVVPNHDILTIAQYLLNVQVKRR